MTTEHTTIVGSLTIEEPRSHQRALGDTASRYEQFMLEPGTYEVHARPDHIYRDHANLFVEVPGVITSKYDGAEFCGIPIGSEPQHEQHADVGKVVSVRLGLNADVEEIAWSGLGRELLCWTWATTLHFTGEYDTISFRTLKWSDAVRRPHRYLVRMPDALPEFFLSEHRLAERVNALLSEGVLPEVFVVTCGEAGGIEHEREEYSFSMFMERAAKSM